MAALTHLSHYRRFKRRGFLALELLVSVALAALLFTLMTGTLHQTVLRDYRARVATAQTYAAMRTSHALAAVVRALDTHRLAIPLRIHEQGEISYTDGTPNPVLHSPTVSIRPSRRSDAVTALELEPLSSFKVKNCSEASGRLLMEGCLKFNGSPFNAGSYHGFAGFGVKDQAELQGKLSGNGPCRSFELRAGKSMSIAPTSFDCRFAVLVPIKAHYTLYLDEESQLRYLGHEGHENIENQPLARFPLKTVINLLLNENSGVHSLAAVLQQATRQEERLSFTNHLARKPPFNFLLNP